MGIIALLIVVGLVLMFLETILPGLIAGALGLLSLGAAVVYGYMEFGSRTGNTTLFIVLMLLAAGTILWVKFFPNSSFAKVFVSDRQIGKDGKVLNRFEPQTKPDSAEIIQAIEAALAAK